MKVAKRLKAAYVLQGKNAIPVGENIFQFKLKSKYRNNDTKKQNNDFDSSSTVSDLLSVEVKPSNF